MAVARDLSGGSNNVIAVIGDGAMSAGMAYEAMNNAGAMRFAADRHPQRQRHVDRAAGRRDERLSGAARLGRPYRYLREIGKQLDQASAEVPSTTRRDRAEEYARGFVTGGTLFEELGFYYVGPIDGHNLDHLLPVLKNVRDHEQGPVLIHVVTQKGKGYAPAESRGRQVSRRRQVRRHHRRAGQGQAERAELHQGVRREPRSRKRREDDQIVAITAAMPSGTGLDLFGKVFPERTFDVGIAEQHAVTFAAGLATEGYKPFCAIYSTFLQRAYDQVVHDVAIQKLPVRFAIDRAGFVGADGADPCRRRSTSPISAACRASW